MAGLLFVLGSVADSDDSSRAGGQPQLVHARSSTVALPHGDFETARFVRRIDNPWWPMASGTSWRFRRIADGETTQIQVAVMTRTRTVGAIEATVVRSVSFVNGKRVDDTRDWYAQDSAGNVWHLGKDAKQYENGVLAGTAGSWEAGVHGAQAGIVVPSSAKVGTSYPREHRRGELEGRGRIVSLNRAVEVPGGMFARTIVAEATTPVEPRAREHTILARGVGPVLTIDVSGRGRVELIRFTTGFRSS